MSLQSLQVEYGNHESRLSKVISELKELAIRKESQLEQARNRLQASEKRVSYLEVQVRDLEERVSDFRP